MVANRLWKSVTAILCFLLIVTCMPLVNAQADSLLSGNGARIKTFSAMPAFKGMPSLSPGGNNTLTFKYSLTMATQIKLDIFINNSNAWINLLSRDDTAGTKIFTWDGQVAGKYLSEGSYSLRIYTTSSGENTARTIKIRICAPPVVEVSKNASEFTAGNRRNIRLTVKWDVPTSLNICVLDSNSNVVSTLYNKYNQLPAKKKIYWYGKTSGGVYASPGTYFIRISAGNASTRLIPIILRPSLKGELVFDSLNGRKVTVRDGTTPSDLSRGAVWHNQTTFPGTIGNCVVFGHRTTVFKGFGALKAGDIIQFNIPGKTLRYRISEMRVVYPGDEMIFHKYDEKVLTLVTCYPFIWHGHAPQRYLVIAKQID